MGYFPQQSARLLWNMKHFPPLSFHTKVVGLKYSTNTFGFFFKKRTNLKLVYIHLTECNAHKSNLPFLKRYSRKKWQLIELFEVHPEIGNIHLQPCKKCAFCVFPVCCFVLKGMKSVWGWYFVYLCIWCILCVFVCLLFAVLRWEEWSLFEAGTQSVASSQDALAHNTHPHLFPD